MNRQYAVTQFAHRMCRVHREGFSQWSASLSLQTVFYPSGCPVLSTAQGHPGWTILWQRDEQLVCGPDLASWGEVWLQGTLGFVLWRGTPAPLVSPVCRESGEVASPLLWGPASRGGYSCASPSRGEGRRPWPREHHSPAKAKPHRVTPQIIHSSLHVDFPYKRRGSDYL